jgi:ribosome-associated heat shock protein Hsp15
MRVDKWLWQARFFKTRSLAAEVATGGNLRINGQRCVKPAHALAEGDVLTFPQSDRIRLIRVIALSLRRGPAQEAQALYQDMDGPGAESVPSPLE